MVTGGDPQTGPPYQFVNIQETYPWTWNQKGVCAYCAHCTIALRMVPIEELGYPIRVVEYPTNPQSVCKRIINKDRKSIPPEAYAAVGYQPPYQAVSYLRVVGSGSFCANIDSAPFT